MKRKVRVRERVRVKSANGGYTETLRDAGEWWAEVEQVEGNEEVQAMQRGAFRPHRFAGHYRASLTAATELAYDGRRFDVVSVVDPGARRRKTIIVAEEIRAGA